MIICMNIGTDGERYIAYILYSKCDAPNRIIKEYSLSRMFDEVYVIDFKENEAFIDEVVLRGCRV